MADITVLPNQFAVYDGGNYYIYEDFPAICFNTFVCPIHSTSMIVIGYYRAWSYAEIVAISKSQGWIDDDLNWVTNFPLPISSTPWARTADWPR